MSALVDQYVERESVGVRQVVEETETIVSRAFYSRVIEVVSEVALSEASSAGIDNW